MNDPRPVTVFDTGLQHERTSLAWERTAISMMVAGLVLSRFAATKGFWLLAAGGLTQVVFGAAVLVWSGAHYEQLHGALRGGTDVVHPSAARSVGLVTILGTGTGLVAAIVATLTR
ncbi:MAG TPA: DUF202 domain-containing protein [Ilumatobacteraceae bacterium]|nr:DUF202 domain-containing protein [Ilumatobacteraceae bacterium]